MMRRLLPVAALVLAGCQNVLGPFAYRQPQRVDDPRLSIAEQHQRGRDRLALPEDDVNIAPRTYTDRPDPHGHH